MTVRAEVGQPDTNPKHIDTFGTFKRRLPNFAYASLGFCAWVGKEKGGCLNFLLLLEDTLLVSLDTTMGYGKGRCLDGITYEYASPNHRLRNIWLLWYSVHLLILAGKQRQKEETVVSNEMSLSAKPSIMT